MVEKTTVSEPGDAAIPVPREAIPHDGHLDEAGFGIVGILEKTEIGVRGFRNAPEPHRLEAREQNRREDEQENVTREYA